MARKIVNSKALRGTMPVFLTDPQTLRKDHLRSCCCIKSVEEQKFGVTWILSCCTRVLKTITSNKLRGQKSRNAFHIASQKSFKTKDKTKPITTTPKKINIVNDENVDKLSKAFVDIYKEPAYFSTAESSAVS